MSFAADAGVRANASNLQYRRSSGDDQLKTLSGQLNLSAEQRIKVKKILELGRQS